MTKYLYIYLICSLPGMFPKNNNFGNSIWTWNMSIPAVFLSSKKHFYKWFLRFWKIMTKSWAFHFGTQFFSKICITESIFLLKKRVFWPEPRSYSRGICDHRKKKKTEFVLKCLNGPWMVSYSEQIFYVLLFMCGTNWPRLSVVMCMCWVDWVQVGSDIDGDVGDGQKGNALSRDGTVLAVGAIRKDPGHVRVPDYIHGKFKTLKAVFDEE